MVKRGIECFLIESYVVYEYNDESFCSRRRERGILKEGSYIVLDSDEKSAINRVKKIIPDFGEEEYKFKVRKLDEKNEVYNLGDVL